MKTSQEIKYDVFNSPLGEITIISSNRCIIGLHISGDRHFLTVPREWLKDLSDPILRQAKIELSEYFSGKRKEFDLPVSTSGTVFQKLVWDSLKDIPFGSTSTYAEIARKIGNPKAVRAVGTAIGQNPISIILPCHRIIRKDGSLGDFAAGMRCKKKLLDLENTQKDKLPN